jgi:MipA family protein
MNHLRIRSIGRCGKPRAPLQSKSRYSRRPTMHMLIGLAFPLAMLTMNMPSAAADKTADGDDVESSGAGANHGSTARDSFSDTWKIQLGAGAFNGARYPGSRYNFTQGVPVVSISYDRYFLGAVPGGGAPAGLGAYLLHTEHWALGLDVGGGGRKPRRASDDAILHGWGDISGTARGGMFASYRMDWLSVRGAISAAGHHEGVVASFDVDATYHATPRLTLSIGPEVTWVNTQYAMTFFGLDAAQSEIARIAPYRARSGINSVGGSVSANYMLTQHWLFAAHASYGRLQGDAANSPVTTDKTQRGYGAFIMYRF